MLYIIRRRNREQSNRLHHHQAAVPNSLKYVDSNALTSVQAPGTLSLTFPSLSCMARKSREHPAKKNVYRITVVSFLVAGDQPGPLPFVSINFVCMSRRL